jgi:hypothetical protein
VQKITALLHRFPRWAAIGAGALSAYGFAPWGLWPLTLACFALLIHLIAHAQNTKRAFILGWLFGVGHFTFGNQWVAVAFTFQADLAWLYRRGRAGAVSGSLSGLGGGGGRLDTSPCDENPSSFPRRRESNA